MKVFLVHAHPEPASFNGAMRDLAVSTLTAAGHEVRVSDLYAMGFDPVLGRHDFLEATDPRYFKPQREQLHASEHGAFAPDVAAEIEKLFWADFLLFGFPLWWFSLPAILKGWVDRVFVMGAVYGGGRIYGSGVLEGRRAMLALTTGGPAASFAPGGVNGEIEQLLFPIQHGMLHFVGMEVLPPFVAYGAARQTSEERQATLEAYRARLLALETTAPLAWG
jgi:NAD(P)H dehydrogenase (quinone)